MGRAKADQPARKKPCLSHPTGETVQVLVGPDKESFDINKDLLCSRSTFFEAACAARWNRGGESFPIELPEEEDLIFNVYLTILIKNEVDRKKLVVILQELPRPASSEDVQFFLVNTYFLADKLGDVVTANKIIDELIDDCALDKHGANNGFGTPVAVEIAENTTCSSPLRKLVIDFYVHAATMHNIDALLATKSVPCQFVGEILREKTRLEIESRVDGPEAIEQVYNVNFARGNHCPYYQHDNGNPHCGGGCYHNPGRDGSGPSDI